MSVKPGSMADEPAAEAPPEEEALAEGSDAPADVRDGGTAEEALPETEEEEENADEAAPESDEPPDGLSPIPIKKRPPPKKRIERPPQEEIEAALDLLLRGVPPEDFDPVALGACMEELQKLKRDAVSQKNYLEADFYTQLIKRSQKAADVSKFSTQCCGQLTYFLEKQADAQDKVDETDRTWQQIFQEFEETVDFKMQKLTDAQNEELDKFDRERPTELTPGYTKHSVDYVAMRKRERLLIRNEDYVTADAVKRKADALEDEELTNQHLRLQDDLQRQRNAKIEKHSQQFSAFASWLNGRRHEMVRARAKDMEGPLRRLAHYTRLVERIEKKGLPPNPYHGFTTNRVSRQESVTAVRKTAQTPLDRDPSKTKPREKPPIPGFRPTSAMNKTAQLTKPKTAH
jgi:CTP:phosphocholine cytidylyltransferase-like protein